MELSRQRLQTSLGETSHMTCPRCNGIGHIRSVESSSLHILRILQEEAMKENTAALHAQVPVDVATFLLNEKRSEFHAIEQRLKVNVVLIPNMHLETPNYTVTRLRHDELNQMEPLPASYRMVEQPTESQDTPEAAEAKPVRPQAAVQGITPEQPAPMPEAATPASAAHSCAGAATTHSGSSMSISMTSGRTQSLAVSADETPVRFRTRSRAPEASARRR